MRTSDSIELISTALAAAQGEITDPVKDKTNPHLKSKYADVQDGLMVVRPVLSKHGIAVVQATAIVDGMVIVTTRLMHKGEWIEGDYPVAALGVKQQDMMAALTYARRAGLFGLVGIAPADDMDGEGAGNTPSPRSSYRQQEAVQRSMEKASSAPIRDAVAAAAEHVPHDPDTGEVIEPAMSEADSRVLADQLIAKLEVIAKSPTKAKLQVWARANKPLKDRLHPGHQKDVMTVFEAVKLSASEAEKQPALEAAE